MPLVNKSKKKKKHKHSSQHEPPDYRQQAFWDLERTAEDVAAQTYELHNAVTELGAIVEAASETVARALEVQCDKTVEQIALLVDRIIEVLEKQDAD